MSSPARAQTSVRGVDYASSPLLASKTPNWRSRLLVALVALGFLGLIARAAKVQLFDNEFLQQQGAKRYATELERPAVRGRIVDRSGTLLATSVPVPSIWAIPKDFKASDAERQQLARLLGLDRKELEARLAGGSQHFAWIRRHVDPELGAKIAALRIKGLHQTEEYRRKYPEGPSAAHVVGFTNLDDQGQEGVELAFQKALQGHKGRLGVVRDRLGQVIDESGVDVEAADGRDVVLSIDAKVQYFAYQRLREAVTEHKAKAGSVVVLDVQTGEILALANLPSYDPGERGRLSGEQLRNRALTDIFEPGSTMKPFIVGWGLDSGHWHPNSMVNATPGSLSVGPLTVRDAHPYGMLTLQQVIQKSSNIGTVRVAMTIPPREMWEMFSALGFGQKPQIDFPGTVTGRLRPWKTWKPVEQATMAYGYGLSASLLQIARAYTALARDGDVIPVSLLKQDQPPQGVPVFKPETAREVRKMLQMAAGPGGTGERAMTNGYSVGGKSGTAHKQEGRGYASNKYRSWFVGMAPIDRPRIVVGVMLDEPSNGVYYGGAVAAPVFSQVVQQTLRLMNVAPDVDVRSQVIAKAGAAAAPETVQ